MKKSRIFGIGVIILVIILFLFLRVSEDDWIKDSNGLWVEHGNPSQTSDFVKEQQLAISCANALYQRARSSGMSFNSQCLGRCQDYSVDIVNVPRTADDERAENQCSDYKNKITKNFIELNKYGDVVRVV